MRISRVQTGMREMFVNQYHVVALYTEYVKILRNDVSGYVSHLEVGM